MAILSAIARALRRSVWFAAGQYFRQVRLLHPERLPAHGPVLYVGLHRNGALVVFLYHRVVPLAVYMISRQLRRSMLGRMFFTGIEVVRDKDRAQDSGADRARNQAALEVCMRHLHDGGELFVLPEGTSDLGPRHLPFKRGAAHIAAEFLARGGRLTIIPLGIHYERAWAFRSDVEIVVGEPIDTQMPDLLHERMTQALEAVGVNLETAAEQERVEQLAYAATLGTPHSYFHALKTFEADVPTAIASAFDRLDQESDRRGLWRHQGVPLVPLAHPWLYALALAPLSILVLAALLLNLPPILCALAASRAFADARNVIALWRILVGLPVLGLWMITLAVLAPLPFIAYLVVSALGLIAFHRTKKLAIAVHNWIRGRMLRGQLHALHRQLDEAVRHAT